ncbi:hypothetical protein Clacol_007571 [Clathrus columnatus]|uniref:Uncharacterized protein n=1 Tax=Clathrus columnatus TaxID=1419009 RepID=A0AAV5AFA1_9AGAM|nr:hypothetical protein Clacol_007571 [Clathrus columnatus]
MSLGSCTTRQFIRVLTLQTPAIRYQSTLIRASLSPHGSNYNNQPSSSEVISNPAHALSLLPPDDVRLRALLNKGKQGALAIDFIKARKLYSSTISRLYERLRQKPFLQTLLPSDYVILAREFNIMTQQTLMGYLAEDLLAYFPREHDPEGFSQALATVLNNAVPSLIPPSQTLALYNAFSAVDCVDLPDLKLEVWRGVFNAAILYPDDCTFTLQTLGLAFLKQAQRTGSFSLKVPQFLSDLILEMLMQGEDMYNQALAVFKPFVLNQLLPGMNDILEGSSFKFAIARTLILGHLLAHDYVTSVELVIRLLKDPRWFDPRSMMDKDCTNVGLLSLEVLHTVIREPVEKELECCLRLVKAFVPSGKPSWRGWEPVDIPDGDILALYDLCFHYRRINDAADLYAHFHSSYIRQRRYYPPPRGPSLFWLFEHYADPGLTIGEGDPAPLKGHLRMAKNILRDIVVRNTPVPIHDRRKFITVCANRGFAFYTRYFYELWTKKSDLDRNVVCGSAQMLVPVVKLFGKLQKVWDKSLEKNKSPDEMARRLMNEKRSVLPEAWRFANHVVQQYLETKVPLNKASQQDINALARAYLILDRIPEAIQMLFIIMDRGDIPDHKDINIALLAISIYSVPVAVRMLEYMITMGVMPSPSGFSALIHEAYKQGQEDIARKLVARAREIGYSQLTTKGLAGIVQFRLPHSMNQNMQGQHQTRRLKTLEEMLDAVIRYSTSNELEEKRDHGKQHILSVSMGERYVTAALACRKPKMAVKFWRLLVKNRTSWNDPESEKLRHLIGTELRKSKLYQDEINRLLEELGQPWRQDGEGRDGKKIVRRDVRKLFTLGKDGGNQSERGESRNPKVQENNT